MREIDNFLPHSKDMILLDKFIKFSIDEIRVFCEIKQSVFIRDGKFDSVNYIEIAAQSLGVYDYKFKELNGLKADFGFLLGCRKFSIFKPFLCVGDKILVVSSPVLQDNSGLGIYSSQLFIVNDVKYKDLANVDTSILQKIAFGKLNVFSPESNFIDSLRK